MFEHSETSHMTNSKSHLIVEVEEPRVKSHDEGQRRGEVVRHADGAERDVGALPVEREDDLHDCLRHRRQHGRPQRVHLERNKGDLFYIRLNWA